MFSPIRVVRWLRSRHARSVLRRHRQRGGQWHQREERSKHRNGPSGLDVDSPSSPPSWISEESSGGGGPAETDALRQRLRMRPEVSSRHTLCVLVYSGAYEVSSQLLGR